MEDLKLFDGEYKFICIIWEMEPVNSTELFRACEKRLGWKKSTTYTMLRKLSARGLLQNENATVTTLVKREQVQKYESQALVGKAFDGSLPAFVAAYLKDRRLTEKEVLEIMRMIKEATE